MNFNDAVEIILAHEGGYVNDLKDPGGETKFGISKRSYPDLDIKNLTRQQAKDIYRKDYWNKVRGDSLPFSVSLILFDWSVTSGPVTASKALQGICGVKRDGVIGEQTIAAVNHLSKNSVCEKLTTERILYYTGIKNFDRFGKGWTERSIETLSSALLIRDYV